MADNVVANSGSGGATFATASGTWSGDTANFPGCFSVVISGSEGSWTITQVAGGAGAVSAGVQRMTLASDDPAVVALQILDNAISGSEMQVDIVSSATLTVTGTGGTFPVTDSGGSLTVDNNGTFAVQAVCTNGGTFVVQENGAALTALQLIDDVIATLGTTTYTEAASKGAIIAAVRRDADTTLVDTTNELGPLQMDANGRLKVEVFSGEALPVTLTSTTVTGTVAVTQSGTWDEVGINDSGNSITVDNGGTFVVQVDGSALTALQLIDDAIFAEDVAAQAADKGIAFLAVRRDADTSLVGTDNDYANLQVDANGYLKVEIFDGGGSHTVDNGGTFAVQESGGALTALQIMDDWDNAASDGASVSGDVAHGTADAGEPVKIGARVETSLKGITLEADADRTNLYADADGVQVVKLGTTGADAISESVSNTDGASTAFTNFSAVASTFNHVTAYSVFRTDSGTSLAYIDFRDGMAGSVLWRVPLPPSGGANLSLGGQPIFKTSANTALAFDVSSALTTVYISVSGYQSKV